MQRETSTRRSFAEGSSTIRLWSPGAERHQELVGHVGPSRAGSFMLGILNPAFASNSPTHQLSNCRSQVQMSHTLVTNCHQSVRHLGHTRLTSGHDRDLGLITPVQPWFGGVDWLRFNVVREQPGFGPDAEAALDGRDSRQGRCKAGARPVQGRSLSGIVPGLH